MVFVGHDEVTDVPHEGGQNPFTLDITDYVKKGENEPYFIIGTLDQGWWPDGLLTYDRKVLKFSPAVLKAAHDRVVSRAKAAAYAK